MELKQRNKPDLLHGFSVASLYSCDYFMAIFVLRLVQTAEVKQTVTNNVHVVFLIEGDISSSDVNTSLM